MLQLDILLDNKSHKEKEYYDYRKTLHDIYDKDVWYGDLAGDILAYREKDRHVESISIDIKSYKISAELDENVKDKDVDKVIENMKTILTDFVDTVSDKLPDDTSKTLIEDYNHSSWPIFDCYVNGSSIEFIL